MKKEDLDFLSSQRGINISETKIEVCSKSITSNDAAVNEIKNFGPADGWISFQSTPAKRVQGSDFDVTGQQILAGEFCNSSGVSMSVRFDGENWLLFSYREAEEGEPVLKKTVRQLSKIDGKTYLNYNVYYKFNPDLGYRPYCSAFVDFTEGKDD